MRDFIVIGIICAAALAIGTVLFYFGPASLRSDVSGAFSTTASSTVSFTVVAQGAHATSMIGRTNYRITNADDFATLWGEAYSATDANDIPPIDFSHYEVLGVFDGSHSSNGYAIRVSSVVDQGGARTVTIAHQIPGTKCPVSHVSTSPFQLIQVPKTEFTLVHTDITSTSTCAN